MTVLQLEGGPRVRRVDQMGEVGEQCGDTLDYSSQLSLLLFYRLDIGRHYRPVGLLRRVDRGWSHHIRCPTSARPIYVVEVFELLG